MDIQDQYLDIQLCDKHLMYSVLISKYLAVMSKIFKLTYTEKKMLLNQKNIFPKACISWIQINIL